jgi:hypothetical protein
LKPTLGINIKFVERVEGSILVVLKDILSMIVKFGTYFIIYSMEKAI